MLGVDLGIPLSTTQRGLFLSGGIFWSVHQVRAGTRALAQTQFLVPLNGIKYPTILPLMPTAALPNSQNFVLIFSEEEERTTDQVLEWLDYYGQTYYRINTEDTITCHSVQLTNEGLTFRLVINGQDTLSSSQIKSFWYRRGWASLKKPNQSIFQDITLEEESTQAIQKQLSAEVRKLNELIYHYLENGERSIGKSSNADNNKLIHFQIAQKLGLHTPITYVCTQKEDVLQLLSARPQRTFVTKSISDAIMLHTKEGEDLMVYLMYTTIFDEGHLAQLPDEFFPSLLQEKLEKRYDLRIFYLKGEFYPMAIFSQNDPRTSVDFRNYNYEKPNRWVPFTLPIPVKERLQYLMDALELNTGSIDMVVTPDHKYYFLEVNPVGQFGMVSVPCNYFLERRIAQMLLQA